ncbi:MAG: glutamate-5-semialdehyde dehydrogenase [Candidatus Caenarcaniphilales bacterium]|nr:glutamate-5-semialdehyde dehydrogenase [Candidatus Caenarcaniphilales bacterium]
MNFKPIMLNKMRSYSIKQEIDLQSRLQTISKNGNLITKSHFERCQILEELAESLTDKIDKILQANSEDQEEQRKEAISGALLDRLTLSPERIKGIADGLKKLAGLPDPLGLVMEYTHPKGMLIQKIRVPIGLLLVVYEARPNVTIDSVGLALKTGNKVVLKGSRQTKYTNQALSEIVLGVLRLHQLEDSIAFFSDLEHDQAAQLIGSEKFDLVIPRGGEKLKQTVLALAKAPVLGAGGGVCHAYISSSADLDMAAELIFNAKTQRPSVCNALEKVLVHESHLKKSHLEKILKKICDYGVELYCDDKVRNCIGYGERAAEDEWHREYLDLKIGVKAVSSLNEAIQHINFYSTGHSDLIVTEDQSEAETFCQQVDSACVYVNVSTRFTDGEEFGLGAEIGISTQKLHARGPIGSHELTTYKYLIKGDGQIRG